MMSIQTVGVRLTGKAMPSRTEVAQITEARAYAGRVFRPRLLMSQPSSGEHSVMTMTDIEAMPPMRPITTPWTVTVSRNV